MSCGLLSGRLCVAQIVFAYASGPLAWSILAFRNSLVFHSLDKVGFGGSSLVHSRAFSVAQTKQWHPGM